MKRLIVGCGIALAAASAALAEGPKNVSVELDGYQEDGAALSTTGRGTFRARISNDGTMIAYELSYSNLVGNILQAHIHLGRHSQSGGIIVFLCSNIGSPVLTPVCPGPTSGEVSGVLDEDDVLGPAGQGIAVGEFGELIRAIRNGAVYVNVHTSTYPTGEIRANVGGHHPGQGQGHGQGHGHGNQ